MGIGGKAACLGVLAAAAAWGCETSCFWHFEEGRAGETARAVMPAGAACVSGKGAAPVYDADVPFKALWDSVSEKPAVPVNNLSLRFRSGDVAGSGAPVGGEVVVSGQDPGLAPASFTLEAFVKVAKPSGRHALIASKRRNGQSGASWSVSLTPAGTLGARFDTEQGAGPQRAGAFNQCFGGPRVPDDGAWHHVAATYDGETRKAVLYVDYQAGGGGTVAAALAYDASDLVIGRGLEGWLDEVRLTPAALHPEQFLRPARFFSDLKPKAAPAVPLLDQTPTRVQSALKPELEKIGTLTPKGVKEIETPMWSLGCETLDRDLADWDAYRGYLAPLGIRRIRLQGGWNRTEKKKGEYDFAWLDHIVDDAHALGLQVCLETSYNNHLYEPGGATGPGGRLPEGEETLAAWDRWVEAMVRHYAPKGVKEWMTYNEPNLHKSNTLERIVANNIRTAEVIRRVDPEAWIGAFVLAGCANDSIEKMLTMIRAQGKLDLFRWAVYHGYSANPDRLCGSMDKLTAMMRQVAPGMQAWQGEAGCASEEVQYALSGIDWTEYSHAKWNTRRMLCDLGCGIDSSVFTISDVSYSKDFISRYGLLKTNPDNSVIKVKTAYYAVQNVVSVFNGALERAPGWGLSVSGTDKQLTRFAFRDRKSGLGAVALWDGTEIPGNGSDLETVRLTVKGGLFKEPVWVDLISGNVYAIPAEQWSSADGTVTFKAVPVYDGPAAVADKSLLAFVPAREKKAARAAAKPPLRKQAQARDAQVVPYLLPGTQQPAPAVLIIGKRDEAAEGLIRWLHGQEVHALLLAEADGADLEARVRAALRAIRARAGEWQVKPAAVGVMAVQANGPVAARAAGGDADFGIVIDGEGAAPVSKRLFVGARDAWQAPLAAWLEPFKGKVF